jgi:hypothetical protein
MADASASRWPAYVMCCCVALCLATTLTCSRSWCHRIAWARSTRCLRATRASAPAPAAAATLTTSRSTRARTPVQKQTITTIKHTRVWGGGGGLASERALGVLLSPPQPRSWARRTRPGRCRRQAATTWASSPAPPGPPRAGEASDAVGVVVVAPPCSSARASAVRARITLRRARMCWDGDGGGVFDGGPPPLGSTAPSIIDHASCTVPVRHRHSRTWQTMGPHLMLSQAMSLHDKNKR